MALSRGQPGKSGVRGHRRRPHVDTLQCGTENSFAFPDRIATSWLFYEAGAAPSATY